VRDDNSTDEKARPAVFIMDTMHCTLYWLKAPYFDNEVEQFVGDEMARTS
jgi:hypothetical protein